MLNPHRLRVLQSVIATGSIQGAARSLHYSPATVSQHMSILAQETGLKLFERSGRGLMPTSSALALAQGSTAVLQAFDELDRLVEGLRRGRSSHLTLASFTSAAKEWLPQVVATLRARDPELTVQISLNEPYAEKTGHPVDIDIRNESPLEPEEHFKGYLRHLLRHEDFAVVLPAGHPLADSETVEVHELSDQMWVDHDIKDSPNGRMIRTAAQAAGFVPQFAARLDDHNAALSLVAAGLGITVLPHLALRDLPRGTVVRALRNPTVQRRIVAHVRQDRAGEELVAAALQVLREESEKSLGAGPLT
ncbi:LysR family transcriptional regulator [Nesterenkonia sp. AN1]|uniref:DNA-binding transcriptional LysR family regulator n=1 Tax=Nesterenkonia aurantiaca TaxID=1436010 RepID=A0A4R7G438_9MICC|nr:MULTISPECIES: LysR family transcriptional regulator [Nesterenkonia]EXF24520.1 LysR family transcriptional regulator [Nesterenkonia sp. AN1]TDS86164.1 DNA-binding transcriptional LysR family regulator [Nesterenkonia aurantiaca]